MRGVWRSFDKARGFRLLVKTVLDSTLDRLTSFPTGYTCVRERFTTWYRSERITVTRMTLVMGPVREKTYLLTQTPPHPEKKNN